MQFIISLALLLSIGFRCDAMLGEEIDKNESRVSAKRRAQHTDSESPESKKQRPIASSPLPSSELPFMQDKLTHIVSSTCSPYNSVMYEAVVEGRGIDEWQNTAVDFDVEDKNGVTPLMIAVEKCYLEMISVILKKRPNFERKYRDGRTILQNAMLLCGDSHALRLLEMWPLEGARHTDTDDLGNTILHYAAFSGHVNVIEHFLINLNEIKDLPNARGDTPLAMAVQNNKVAAARLLLKKQANPTVFDEERNSLFHQVAYLGHVEVATLLAEFGAPENGLNVYMRTPIFGAVIEEREKMVTFLANRKSDLHGTDYKDECLLHHAARTGTTRIMMLILKAFAGNVDLENHEKETPLLIAAKGRQCANVALLLGGKANPNAANNHRRSPLHEAVSAGYTEIVEKLIHAKADIEASDMHGCTPLMVAFGCIVLSADGSPNRGASKVPRNSEEMIDMLLTNNANIMTRDNKRNSVLHGAAVFWTEYAVNMAISKNIGIEDTNNFGYTPLIAAVMYDDEIIVPDIVDKWGANIHAADIYGRNCLHHSVKARSVRVTRFLLERGSDMLHKDQYGITPLQMALNGIKQGVVATGSTDKNMLDIDKDDIYRGCIPYIEKLFRRAQQLDNIYEAIKSDTINQLTEIGNAMELEDTRSELSYDKARLLHNRFTDETLKYPSISISNDILFDGELSRRQVDWFDVVHMEFQNGQMSNSRNFASQMKVIHAEQVKTIRRSLFYYDQDLSHRKHNLQNPLMHAASSGNMKAVKFLISMPMGLSGLNSNMYVYIVEELLKHPDGLQIIHELEKTVPKFVEYLDPSTNMETSLKKSHSSVAIGLLKYSFNNKQWDVVEYLITKICSYFVNKDEGIFDMFHKIKENKRNLFDKALVSFSFCTLMSETDKNEAAVRKHAGGFSFIDYNGNNIVHIAAQQGWHYVLTYLTSEHTYRDLVNAVNNYGYTPLHMTTNPTSSKILLKSSVIKAFDNTNELKQTPLHRVMGWLFDNRDSELTQDEKEMLNAYMEKSTETTINMEDCYGNTALDYVSMKTTSQRKKNKLEVVLPELQVVNILIDNGADVVHVNEYSRTPLHTACSLGNLVIVDHLLSNFGAVVKNINSKDKDGRTPLHLASFPPTVMLFQHTIYADRHKDIVKSLLDAGAIFHFDNNARTPLHDAVLWHCGDVTDVVSSVMKKRDSSLLNAVDRWGRTALYYAVAHRKLASVRILVKIGADRNIGQETAYNALEESNNSLDFNSDENQAAIEACLKTETGEC